MSPAPGLRLDSVVRDTVGKKVQCESLEVKGAQRTVVLCCLSWDLFLQDRAWAMDQRNSSAQVQFVKPASESAGVTWRSMGTQGYPCTALKKLTTGIQMCANMPGVYVSPGFEFRSCLHSKYVYSPIHLPSPTVMFILYKILANCATLAYVWVHSSPSLFCSP